MNIENILIFTSLIFIINSILGLYKKKYIYSSLFFFLTISSFIVHSDYSNSTAIIIDKIIICLILFYGFYTFLKNFKNNILLSIIVFSTFLACIYVYCYGFIIKDLCFHEEICVSRIYHMLMHFFSCIGNLALLFLH
jgi:hypothetical protein